MALKNLSVLDSNVEPYSTEAQSDNHQAGLRAQIYNGALFDELCLPFLEEQPHGTIQFERFQNDDYEIALVLCRNRTRRTGSIVQPSPKTDAALLLPPTLRELLNRVRRELNQSSSVERNMLTRFGEVHVNLLTMEISRSEKPVLLTALEFKLLRFFIMAPERVFSRNELLKEVWEYNNYPSTRTVDNHICMLRRKLEPNPARPIHFLTVHGMGYKFVP